MQIGIGTTYNSPITIDDAALSRHLYLIGATGTGKSVLIENLIAQLIADGQGVCFIDPHGQSARAVVGQIPLSRKDDLAFVDLADERTAPALNFLTGIPIADRALAASNVVASFKHVYADSWGPRMEYATIRLPRPQRL